MAIKQVSERIISNTYKNIDNVIEKHFESNLYIKDGIVYKIIKPPFRQTRYSIMYLIEGESFPYANNIIDSLYQGDKLIGSTSLYLENFTNMVINMYNLDLYEIKIIMSYIIEFFKSTRKKELLYWDIHLRNMGLSNKDFYIMDIDSMIANPKQKNIQYALNSILTLFYEMYYKRLIRNENEHNFNDIIYNISESEKFKNYKLTLEDVQNIINNTSYDYLEEKKLILK